jgi:ABC-type cobalamin transport system permease subunit
MKKIVTILGFSFAVIATLLAVLPLFKFAFIPAILALIFSILAFLKARKDNSSTQFIQLGLLLTIISLVLCTYKSIFSKSELGDMQQLEKREETIKEEAIEELNDIDIEDLDLDL